MRACGLVILGFLPFIAFAAAAAAPDDELQALIEQTNRLYAAGKYREAVPLAQRTVELSRTRYGETDPRYAESLNGLSTFLRLSGSLDRAEETLRQALAIDATARPADDPGVATRLGNLAVVLLDEDKPGEAAALLQRALAAFDRQPNAPPQGDGVTLSNLAGAFARLNRPKEAEELYLGAVAALQKKHGGDDPSVANALYNLGILYKTQHRFERADACLEKAVAILEQASAPDKPHPELAIALNDLGSLRDDEKRPGEAEALYRRALDIDRAMFGADNPRVAIRLSNLANLYINQQRFDDAGKLLAEAMRIDRAAYGNDHPKMALLFLAAARLFVGKKDWERAHALIDGAVAIMTEADEKRRSGGTLIAAGREVADVSLSQIVYATYLQISGEWPWSDTSQFAKLGPGAFDVAQRLVTPEAASAIARMAQRYASGNAGLAAKVRQRQDLVKRWNDIESAMISEVARPNGAVDHDVVAQARTEQADLEQRIKTSDAALRQDAPNYAALAATSVLTIAQTQKLLADDEALVFFAEDGVHIHAFFLTRQRAFWMPLPSPAAAIADDVKALRCGLDAAMWRDERAGQCRALLNINYTDDDYANNRALPFDLARAHELYDQLFGKLGPSVAGKRLIVVPTGALATLPFQVLVTEPPDAAVPPDDRYRKAAWFARQQPITVLPSVASLAALRQIAHMNRATQQFIGFGDPLLDGQQNYPDPVVARQQEVAAALARTKTKCPKETPALAQQMAATTLAPTGRGADGAGETVRELSPLPETADELCAIARDLGVDDDNVWLGARATKPAIEELSRSGQLATYSIIHFATHGLVGGEVPGLAEPALVVTPPATPSGDSDGLLTASDVAELKLDADWVVLSACNTAAGAGDNSEAFSGLARAFFFAGTRALLASHWEVYSEAAVSLTTGAYTALHADPTIGRAEALRRSMVELIDAGGVKSRPAYWAPFVVVGDGGS